MLQTVIITNANQFNHGCRNDATVQLDSPVTGTVTHVNSCNSCWQVGHDADYTFARIGDRVQLDDQPDKYGIVTNYQFV